MFIVCAYRCFANEDLFQNVTVVSPYTSFRTTKTGGLPNLSFVARKPKPLGTEFKNVVDGMSGVMMWLEIQEGKERMRALEHTQAFGGTTACVLRGVKATCSFTHIEDATMEDDEDIGNDHSPYLYFADSWFGSVKSVANVRKTGNHCCFIIKTAHSRSPKFWLEDKMKHMPGGTWIVLEGKPEKEDVELLCIGYKYNKKKVLTFVMTRGAGSTKAGEPYEARFPDKYGNVCIRHVMRPAILSQYFKFSNCVDLHNQSRQFDLALEEKWVTQNPYFRLYTTMIGMTVVDAWKIDKMVSTDIRTIKEYADILANDMIKAAKDYKNAVDTRDVQISIAPHSYDSVSSLSQPDKNICSHTKVILKGGQQVRCVWCSRVNLKEKKTTMKCLECDRGFCRDGGKECWSHHVALGGIPKPPPRGSLKRKINEIQR